MSEYMVGIKMASKFSSISEKRNVIRIRNENLLDSSNQNKGIKRKKGQKYHSIDISPLQIKTYNKNIKILRNLSEKQSIYNDGVKCFCNCKMKLMQVFKKEMKIKCQRCLISVSLWDWYYQCTNYAFHESKIEICAKCIMIKEPKPLSISDLTKSKSNNQIDDVVYCKCGSEMILTQLYQSKIKVYCYECLQIIQHKQWFYQCQDEELHNEFNYCETCAEKVSSDKKKNEDQDDWTVIDEDWEGCEKISLQYYDKKWKSFDFKCKIFDKTVFKGYGCDDYNDFTIIGEIDDEKMTVFFDKKYVENTQKKKPKSVKVIRFNGEIDDYGTINGEWKIVCDNIIISKTNKFRLELPDNLFIKKVFHYYPTPGCIPDNSRNMDDKQEVVFNKSDSEIDYNKRKSISGKIIKKGYMSKKGGVIKNWKTRYFELWKNPDNTGNLIYYDENNTRKGTVKLDKTGKLKPTGKKGLEVITNTRTWCFLCFSESDRNCWKDQINGCLTESD